MLRNFRNGSRWTTWGLLLALLPTVALADIVGAARIIDGDTIEVAGERIRPPGIELAQTYKEDRRVVPTLPIVDLVGPALSANLTETPAPLGITVGRWR